MAKEDNVDFHLLIDQVSAAKLVKGKSARGDIPTYMIRFVDGNGSVAVSLLVMWRVGTDGDYDDGQVEAFESLLEKYGPEIQFSSWTWEQIICPSLSSLSSHSIQTLCQGLFCSLIRISPTA